MVPDIIDASTSIGDAGVDEVSVGAVFSSDGDGSDAGRRYL